MTFGYFPHFEGLFLLAHCSVTSGGAHARAQFQRRAAGGFVCIAFFNRSEHVQCGVKTLFQSRKKLCHLFPKIGDLLVRSGSDTMEVGRGSPS